MTAEKPDLTIEEEAKKELQLLDDPFIRAEQLDRAGISSGPPLPLGIIWNDIGSGVSDKELAAWENQS